jgi:hypothetical protein
VPAQLEVGGIDLCFTVIDISDDDEYPCLVSTALKKSTKYLTTAAHSIFGPILVKMDMITFSASVTAPGIVSLT